MSSCRRLRGSQLVAPRLLAAGVYLEECAGKCRRGDRSPHARPPSRRGRDQSHSGAIVPLAPAECAVRRARAPVADQRRRRNARGAHAASAWQRVNS